MRRRVIVLGGVAALGVLLYYTGLVEGQEGQPSLPSCESSQGQTAAKRIFENSPAVKTIGLEVIAMTDEKTVTTNEQKVECTATVILNSANKATLRYSFFFEPALGPGKIAVKSFIDLDSVKPWP